MLGVILIIFIVLAQFNLFLLKDFLKEGDTYIIKQIFFSTFAIILYLYIRKFRYSKQMLSFFNILFIINLFLLLVAFFTPYKIRATKRWIDLYLISVQPAELLKLTLPTFFVMNIYTHNLLHQIGLILIALFTIGIVGLQPNLSNAIILFLGWLSIFIFNPFWSVPRKFYIFLLVLAGFFTILKFNLKPYHYERISGFLDVNAYAKSSAYQTLIARKVISQTGIYSTPIQHTFQLLPEKHNDFVFVSIIYNFGKITGILIMFLYFIMLISMVEKIFRTESRIVRLLFISYITILSIQTIVSLSINITILPVAGITVPFLSYGGSSLLTFTAIVGVMDNKYLQKTKFLFETMV